MVLNSMEELFSSKFKYEIVLDLLSGDQYRLIRYNSPYKSSEQELDDIEAMLKVPGYKILELDKHAPGKYKLEVECLFIPNSDNTYDQVFKLLAWEPLSNGNS